jgi:hypothetical protein
VKQRLGTLLLRQDKLWIGAGILFFCLGGVILTAFHHNRRFSWERPKQQHHCHNMDIDKHNDEFQFRRSIQHYFNQEEEEEMEHETEHDMEHEAEQHDESEHMKDAAAVVEEHEDEEDSEAATEEDYAIDDDYALNTYQDFDDAVTLVDLHECRRTDLAKPQHAYPNCNSLHEIGFDSKVKDGVGKHVGMGTYYLVFSVWNEVEKYVIKGSFLEGKSYRNDLHTYPYELHRRGQLDASISGTMNPHPLFVNIYGYCGLTLVSEFLNDGVLSDIALPIQKDTGCLVDNHNVDNHDVGNDDDDSHSHGGGRVGLDWGNLHKPLLVGNDLDPMQKLNYSLDMAQALALLHNHEHGVIVHGDLWLSQFLVTTMDHHHHDSTSSGVVHTKLNDFNNAKILQYDETHDEYCPARVDYPKDRVRTPCCLLLLASFLFFLSFYIVLFRAG